MNSIGGLNQAGLVRFMHDSGRLSNVREELNNPHYKVIEANTAGNNESLTIKEKLEVKEMEHRERGIRRHEQEHLMAARDMGIGSPSFQYKRGPDGKKYAVHGEVNIDASLVGSEPAETIDKALKMQRSALAPSDPSAKDMDVAARARSIEAKAHRKLSREEVQESATQNETREKQALGELVQPKGIDGYQNGGNAQENLFKILDLFA